MAVMPLAFIGGTEIFWIILLGLMLFGGKLPEVAKEMGKLFFKARRSINEIRRESGIEDAIRDIEREASEVTRSATDVSRQVQKAAAIPDWRQAVDHTAGPGSTEPEADASLEANSEQGSDADSAPRTEPTAEEKSPPADAAPGSDEMPENGGSEPEKGSSS